MEITDILGFVAGTLTTFSFLPQVVKTLKTRHTGDISLFMFIMLVAGIVLWIIYGAVRGDAPVVIANSISLFLVSMMLLFKLKYG